jgi:hypothetical protein
MRAYLTMFFLLFFFFYLRVNLGFISHQQIEIKLMLFIEAYFSIKWMCHNLSNTQYLTDGHLLFHFYQCEKNCIVSLEQVFLSVLLCLICISSKFLPLSPSH